MKNKKVVIGSYESLGDALLMEKMFFHLLEDSLNFIDRQNIHEYFLYRTLGACENGEDVGKLVELYEKLEGISHKLGNEFYSAFYFSLAQMLTIKFGYKKHKEEIICKESFLESFRETKNRLEL